MIVGASDNVLKSVNVIAKDSESDLANKIGENNLLKVTKLKVSGTINSYDMMIIRNKMINLRELDSKIAELTRKGDTESARKVCLNTYKVETPDKSKSNYMYIKSVSFEPNLRSCHVCRIQQVCEQGGESKMNRATKFAAGGASTFGAAGASINPIWGTLIGGAVGAVAGGIGGYVTGEGKKDFCQEIPSCEDINM